MLETRHADKSAAGFVPDTIFAPATGTGQAAVAIVRISGEKAHHVLQGLTRARLPPWRTLALRDLIGADGMMIDRAMVAAFPAGASYTGEAMAELHCHGSRAVLADLMAELARVPGCRLAEPGEFTHRAFLAGRMDLSEAEGLADLIAAETSHQRRQALRMHNGAVSRQAEAWRAMLLRARALVEVTIDWADEDVPENVLPEIAEILRELEAAMESELSRSGPAERMRSGLEVAIVGPPNVGKSSLLNAIAGREAAIVSEIAGTTRDVIEVRFDLSGLPVIFLDTAGIREAQDAVETIGVDLARRRAAAADLRLLMASPDTAAADDQGLWRAGDIRVWAKSDLRAGVGDVLISAASGQGIDALLAMLEERLSERAAISGVFGHVRQRLAVEEAAGHIRRSFEMLGHGSVEYLGEELRLSCQALDKLMGRIGVEDVLGEVFGSFCLGK